MSNEVLTSLTEADIRHELRGFSESAIEAFIALRQTPTAPLLRRAVLEIISFYLPRGTQTDLLAQPSTARLREDLGVDSLTFAEAAYKMEELFGARIENGELAEIKTLRDLQHFAETRLLGTL